ncbi:hypothetical protein NMY22_g10013 [Coprinellus aureogranulatus]|nr:hypothetical protein NMY22_g10013 [Coprinellus aureogranulatus]
MHHTLDRVSPCMTLKYFRKLRGKDWWAPPAVLTFSWGQGKATARVLLRQAHLSVASPSLLAATSSGFHRAPGSRTMVWYESYVEICLIYVHLYGELFMFNLLCVSFAATIPSRPGSPLLPFSSLASFLDDGEEDGCPVKDVKTTSHGSEHSSSVSTHASRSTSPTLPFRDCDEGSSVQNTETPLRLCGKEHSTLDNEENAGSRPPGPEVSSLPVDGEADPLSQPKGDGRIPDLVKAAHFGDALSLTNQNQDESQPNSSSTSPAVRETPSSTSIVLSPRGTVRSAPATIQPDLSYVAMPGPIPSWLLHRADRYMPHVIGSKKDPFQRSVRNRRLNISRRITAQGALPLPTGSNRRLARNMRAAFPMVLEALVEHVPGSNPSTWREGERGLVAMSQVSRELRSLIFGLPLLWSRVLNPDCQGLRVVMRVLELSKNAELHITFSHGHRRQRSKPEFAVIIVLVLRAFSRCNSIRVDRPDCWILDYRRPPSLRSVTIDLRRADYVPHQTTAATAPSPSMNQQLIHAPGVFAIASLFLNGYTGDLPTIASMTLTSLDVRQPFDRRCAARSIDRTKLPTALDWITILASFPNLRYVSLVNCINSKGSRQSVRAYQDVRYASLPQLQSVTLAGDPEIYTFLLGAVLHGMSGVVDVELHFSFEDADIPTDTRMAAILFEALGYIPDDPEYVLWYLVLRNTTNVFSLIAHAVSGHQFAITFEPLRSLHLPKAQAGEDRYMKAFTDFLSMAGMQNGNRMEKALQLCIFPPFAMSGQKTLLTVATPFFKAFHQIRTLSLCIPASQCCLLIQGFELASCFPALRAISVPAWETATRQDVEGLIDYVQSRGARGKALAEVIFANPWEQTLGHLETVHPPVSSFSWWKEDLFSLPGVSVAKAKL